MKQIVFIFSLMMALSSVCLAEKINMIKLDNTGTGEYIVWRIENDLDDQWIAMENGNTLAIDMQASGNFPNGKRIIKELIPSEASQLYNALTGQGFVITALYEANVPQALAGTIWGANLDLGIMESNAYIEFEDGTNLRLEN